MAPPPRPPPPVVKEEPAPPTEIKEEPLLPFTTLMGRKKIVIPPRPSPPDSAAAGGLVVTESSLPPTYGKVIVEELPEPIGVRGNFFFIRQLIFFRKSEKKFSVIESHLIFFNFFSSDCQNLLRDLHYSVP